VNPDDLERLRKRLPEVIYRRARHVVSDNARVFQVKEALQEGNVDAVSALMRACHISLRDDYEVSSPELDALAEAAWKVEGCYGSRLTGAGFGGCTVSLVAVGAVPDFQARVAAAYEKAFGRQPEIYVCQTADGVKRMS
jgi:galactokinase